MFRQTARKVFNKYPLVSNSLIYGSLYVGAECSQQIITKKILVGNSLQTQSLDFDNVNLCLSVFLLSVQIKPSEDLDKPTLVRYGVMGTFLYSPILYAW